MTCIAFQTGFQIILEHAPLKNILEFHNKGRSMKTCLRQSVSMWRCFKMTPSRAKHNVKHFLRKIICHLKAVKVFIYFLKIYLVKFRWFCLQGFFCFKKTNKKKRICFQLDFIQEALGSSLTAASVENAINRMHVSIQQTLSLFRLWWHTLCF